VDPVYNSSVRLTLDRRVPGCQGLGPQAREAVAAQTQVICVVAMVAAKVGMRLGEKRQARENYREAEQELPPEYRFLAGTG
jgi:hypothetical protein